MNEHSSSPAVAATVRVVLALTAVSLLAYVPYRYVARPPRFDGFLGSAYALLFPLSILLAVAVLRVAWRPVSLAGLADGRRTARIGRWALGLYGGLWVTMGLMCIPSLTALAEVSPVKGLFATIHMSAQHVLLGFGSVVGAWKPELVGAILGGEGTSERREARPGSVLRRSP